VNIAKHAESYHQTASSIVERDGNGDSSQLQDKHLVEGVELVEVKPAIGP